MQDDKDIGWIVGPIRPLIGAFIKLGWKSNIGPKY